MERTVIEPPRPCFGLEQHRGNPLCTGCPHRKDCASLMGDLAEKVNVDDARFDFMPETLSPVPHHEPEDPDVQQMVSLYGFCYEWVFDRKPKGNVSKYQVIILERVKEAGTSLKLFFLANMLGWKQSHHETAFYPSVLAAEFAVKQVKTFAEACQHRYGAFDVTGLDRLMGSDVAKKDFESHLLNSEIVAGAWIVNYRLFHSGDLLARLYREKELSLNPYWLAIEPSYYQQVLAPRLRSPDVDCPDLIRKHRWNATHVLSKLKKNKRKAIAVFSARERIMPEAVRRVLGQRGLLPEHFQIDHRKVLNALRFWMWLGTAIQHYEYLKFVDNFPSTFDSYFTRS